MAQRLSALASGARGRGFNSRRSDKMKKIGLFEQIRAVVKKIPEGKVATYGQVAKLVGSSDSRKVGWAMYGNKNPQIPCHRVLKKDGFLAEKFSAGGWQEQKKRLGKEGINFKGERQVDLELHLWKA